MISGVLILITSVWWWCRAERSENKLFVVALILALIAWLLHLLPLSNLMFGNGESLTESENGDRRARRKFNSEKITFATIISFVGLIGLDISYLGVVNGARDKALSAAGPANYSGDWAAMEGAHIIVFFGILICVSWFARHLPLENRRPLRSLWTVTLAIFLFHLWGKLDDASDIFCHDRKVQFHEGLAKTSFPNGWGFTKEDARFSDDYQKALVFITTTNELILQHDGFQRYTGNFTWVTLGQTNTTNITVPLRKP